MVAMPLALVEAVAMPPRHRQRGPRLRIVLDADAWLGPGKADILEGIRETGSIAAAGRRMAMSYKRAWQLVETLNGYFEEPLVVTSRGGPGHGGAVLTPTGEKVLACYRRMEARTRAAIADDLAELDALRRTVPDHDDGDT